MTRWRTIALSVADRFFYKPAAPLPLRDLGWKLVNFAAVGAHSNPVSYALRPIVSHPSLRLALGGVLVGLAGLLMIASPTPALEGQDIGGPQSLVLDAGEVPIKTLVSTRKPLDKIDVSQRFWALHSGIDMRAPMGTPIWAIKHGQVVQAERTYGGYGMLVVIEHEDDFASWYGHLSKMNVKVGDFVDTTTIIGEVGSTGRSTGPHLHLEIRENGRIVNPGPILGI